MRSVDTAGRAMYRHSRSSFRRWCACVATPAWSENPEAFATWLLSSLSSRAGTVCRVNALRPAWGPTAMRSVMELVSLALTNFLRKSVTGDPCA
jgi:hypothetical protein